MSLGGGRFGPPATWSGVGTEAKGGTWSFMEEGEMELVRVKYSELNAKQKEVHNFQKIAGLLADYGFNCIKLADDWQGADFLAYHKDDSKTLKVQLKGRLTIDKKYEKGLFMAFPFAGEWYLIEHESLVALVKKHTGWLATPSWRDKGGYSSAKPNKELISALSDFRVGAA